MSKTFSQNIKKKKKKNNLAPFNWKLFKLGSVSDKDIRKNVPILQVGRSSHVPYTPPVVWVVLLH